VWWLVLLPIYLLSARTSCARSVCIGCEFAGSVVAGGWMLCGVVTQQFAWIEAALLMQVLATYLSLFWPSQKT
jgi:hypothetical protein